MAYQQSIEGCLEASIGSGGLDAAGLARQLDDLKSHLEALREAYRDKSLALLQVPDWRDDISEAKAALDRLCEGGETVVFFGTGGSSLGGQALAQLGGWLIPGEFREGQLSRPRTRFYDNLDARTLERTLASLKLDRARFVVISKSGNTAETLVQFLAAIQAVKAAGLVAEIPKMFLGLSQAGETGNGLRKVCSEHGIPVLEHDPQIPGRYSILSNVGALAGFAQGIDMGLLRAGAKSVIDEMLNAAEPADCRPALGAALMVGLMKTRDCHASVMIPYADRLERFSHWYAQLWAESLGKSGEGSTPIAALGPVDQHSQLQLYLDGPKTHVITLIRHDSHGQGPVIEPGLAALAGIGHLAGKHAGELIAAQQDAVPQALMAAGRPVRLIDCGDISEESLGCLFMHFMIETILAARLLGVDPFDQPAVEEGKRLTMVRLAGEGGT